MNEKVKIRNDEHQCHLAKAGAVGVVSGYVRGGNDCPLAVINFGPGKGFELVSIYNIVEVDYYNE